MKPSLALIVMLSLLSGCSWLESFFSSKDNADSGLSYEQAKARAAVVDNVKYELYFELEKSPETFGGETKIFFDLKRKVERLRIDLRGAKVHALTLNGKNEPVDYNNSFLDVKSNRFKKGRNEIAISYDMRYSTFGAGLYKFKDPEDNNSYVYSDFEPFDANRLFPCFDQPDLKATYKTKVTAPKNWTVVTSVRETEVADQGETNLWSFPETKKFSTYIYSLHAGPYHIWEQSSFRYPLRLMARQSLKDHIEPEKWFETTRQGFDYFDEYFGQKYPFTKYDQVIVPDFNSGAMENVAAVTFSEAYIRKGEYTYNDRLRIASVILHEMAHMWFGNLVTMKWWNDLWLNESFASIMAAKALAEATEFKTSWRNFFARMKQWAYWEDQLETTHPIEARVDNTDDAFANFDGITYGKGASVLKQIIFYLGDDQFRRGVRSYFAQNAYKNTELKDFIRALEDGSGTDLSWWSKEWLQTSGVNTIGVTFSCEAGKVNKAHLQQVSKLKTPGLRKHKTRIALLYTQDNELSIGKIIDVIYQQRNTKLEPLIGQKCPDAIYPNYDDHDYVLIELDDKSQATFSERLSDIEDELLRMMIWRNQWDMVLNSKLPVQRYLDLVTRNLKDLREQDILKMVLATLVPRGQANSSAIGYLPQASKGDIEYATTIREELEKIMWQNLNATLNDKNTHIVWFNALASFAQTKAGLDYLAGIFDDPKTYNLVHKSQNNRWRILWRLATYGDKDLAELVRNESNRDKSDAALNWQLAIAVANKNPKNKEKFYHRLIQPDSGDSVRKQKIIAANLFPEGQEKLRLDFAGKYFSDLPKLSNERNEIFLGAFSKSLIPLVCDQKAHSALQKFVQKQPKLKENVTRGIRKLLEDDARCIDIRQRASKADSKVRRM